jgi:hypothetical protein
VKLARLVAASLALASSAHAQNETDVVSGYCDWVRGVAHSERALLHAPDALVRVQPDSRSGVRVRTGLAYDAIRLYRGRLVASRAGAECDRFGASYALTTQLSRGAAETERAALSARLAALDTAIPTARELVANVEHAFAGERATIEELQAVRLRADALAAAHAAARQGMEALGPQTAPLRASRIGELLQTQIAAEREVETIEARLRRANAFRVTLNGGYERGGVHREIPAYGILEVAYNLGAARQYAADASAEEGRIRYARGRENGPDSQLARVMLSLRAELAENERRLGEVSLLRGDAEQRWLSLEGIESERVRRVRDHLWFDLTEARAEEAYLTARVRELAVAVATDAPARVAEAGASPPAN